MEQIELLNELIQGLETQIKVSSDEKASFLAQANHAQGVIDASNNVLQRSRAKLISLQHNLNQPPEEKKEPIPESKAG